MIYDTRINYSIPNPSNTTLSGSSNRIKSNRINCQHGRPHSSDWAGVQASKRMTTTRLQFDNQQYKEVQVQVQVQQQQQQQQLYQPQQGQEPRLPLMTRIVFVMLVDSAACAQSGGGVE